MARLTHRDLPGRAVLNPLGEPPWVLDVAAVAGPDTEGMVTLTTLDGPVRCAADLDWDGLEHTAAAADLMAAMVLDANLPAPERPGDDT